MTTFATFTILCTDEGQHARCKFDELTFDREADRVTAKGLHTRQWASNYAQVTADGEAATMSPFEIRVSESSVTFWTPASGEREEQWRWKCPRCKRDARLSGSRLRLWMRNTPEPTLDVSLLPSG